MNLARSGFRGFPDRLPTAPRRRPGDREPVRGTDGLLLAGVAGPILFVGLTLVEGAIRPGYDPTRQFVSVLGLGDGGWVQAANCLASGLLICAFGLGLRRTAVDARGRWVALLLALTGAALALGGLFPPDPQFGYPYWISAAAAANPTLHARLHFAAGFVASAAFAAVVVIEATNAAQAGAWLRAAYTLVSAGIMIGCFLVGLARENPAIGLVAWGGAIQRLGIVAGAQWLAWFAATHLRAADRRGRVRADSVPSPVAGARSRAMLRPFRHGRGIGGRPACPTRR